MVRMKPVLEEERRKFPWFYEIRVSKEARDKFEKEKETRKTEN